MTRQNHTTEPRAPVRLPLLRCTPNRDCPQRCQCLRVVGPLDPEAMTVDASVLVHAGGAWCPMFIDMRGVALLEAA